MENPPMIQDGPIVVLPKAETEWTDHAIPTPGKNAWKIRKGEMTGYLAVTGLVNCTALALHHPKSNTRAMVHFNYPAGPNEENFAEFFQELAETEIAPQEFTVSLCFNSAKPMNTYPKLIPILEKHFPQTHPYRLCSYSGGSIFLSPDGELSGGDDQEKKQRTGFGGSRVKS
jgi:hypothetical protein